MEFYVKERLNDINLGVYKSETNYFVIKKFPKEFKKGIFKSIDYTFLAILFSCFIIHFSAILYLERNIPTDVNSDTIVQIQKKYVELLLNEEELTPTKIVSNPLSDFSKTLQQDNINEITGLAEWIEGFGNDALESFDDMPTFQPEVFKEEVAPIKEAKVPTRDDISTARAFALEFRNKSRAELENEISNIGLLGLIGGKKSVVDQEYIDDLLDYSELNDDHFANVLSKLQSIKVPHNNTAGYIINQKRRAGIQGGTVKGGRITADQEVEKVIKEMAPLARAKTNNVKRTVKYEKVEPATNALSKLRPSYGDGTIREPKDVMRVVQGHKRALQDCYKQALKYDAAVKGKIIIRFSVNPMGYVINTAAVSSTLSSTRMEKCLLNRISKWRDFGYSDPALGDITYKQVFNFGK